MWLWLIAALCVGAAWTVGLAARAAPAGAQIFNLTAGDPSSDTPEDSFTDDMGLEAIGTSSFRGGTICAVDSGVTDPGDGSLTCDHPAFGGSQPYVGIGSFFLPLVAPDQMKDGVWRLLGDGAFDNTEPDDLSETFTVSPCDTCDPAPAQAMFQSWKDANKQMADDSDTACTLLDLDEQEKEAKDQYKFATGVASDSAGGDFWAVVGDIGDFELGGFSEDALETGYLDQYIALVHELTCRTAEMYKAIVADPPDPNYTTISPPQFSAPEPITDPATLQLSLLLDQIRANGEAELAAVQRFEGAQAANDTTWMGNQAAQAATDGQALADEMELASQQLTTYAQTLQDDGVGTAPLPQAAFDAATTFRDRIRSSGFTADEVSQLGAAGYNGAAQSNLQSVFANETLDSDAVGKTLEQGLDAVAADLHSTAAADGGFAQSFANVAPRQAPPQLTAAIADETTVTTLAPFAARLSAAGSRPGASPIASYRWDFGDGSSDDGVETSHEYTSPGNYTVTLTVTDQDGNTAIATDTVSVIGRSQLKLPVCGDVTYQCAGFQALPPGSAFTVAGTGAQDVDVTFAYTDSGWTNTLVWFPVDDAQGTIDGLAPGQPGWIEAAEARMHSAFDGSAHAGDSLTLHLNGGDHFSLALVSASDLQTTLDQNPLNQPIGTPGFEFQFAAANEYGNDHALPYLQTSDGMIQVGFEDTPAGGDLDYSDDIYDIRDVTPATPASIAATVTADQAQVTPGGDDGYEVKLRNGADATTVLRSISDTLPAGFSYVPGSTRGATTADPAISGSTLTWSGRFTAPGGGVAGVHFAVQAATALGSYLDEGTADADGIPVTGSGPSAEVDVVSEPVTYHLDVQRTGTGSGAVSGAPGRIDCGTTCSDTFTSGTTVTLTEAPADGSLFAGWGGACSGTAQTCTVTVGQARTVTAEFDRIGAPLAPPAAVTAPLGQAPAIRGVPVDTVAPRISGTAAAGRALTCSTGSWTNSPTSHAYQWSRFGTPIAGATGSSYRLAGLDQGGRLTCTVIAANTAGAGLPATSAATAVPVPSVRGCPGATGRAAGTQLGLARLGMTRAQARRAYVHSSTRGRRYEDFFCLTPIGVRVGYASPQLLAHAAHSRGRLAGRVVWISTSNPFYAVDGIRPGATLPAAEARLPHGRIFHVGLNYWYLARRAGVTAILKVRRNVVEEIGIAQPSVTATPRADQSFLRSFS